MDAPRYEVLEHTADLRMAFYGSDLPSLFTAAAYGLFREMAGLELPRATTPPQGIQIAEDGVDLLLRAWLGELLYLYETEHVFFTEWEADITGDMVLRGTAAGVPVSALPERPRLEVKGVTYHGLSVTEVHGGLRAEVTFDL
jgi:SHS2 domain-containing protein